MVSQMGKLDLESVYCYCVCVCVCVCVCRFVMFFQYAIPRENLLLKGGDVTPDGQYITQYKVRYAHYHPQWPHTHTDTQQTSN